VTFAAQIALTKDADFRGRVRMAAITAAVSVAGEAQAGVTVTAYTKRQALSLRVLTAAGGGERGEVLDMFVWAAAANPSLTAESTDSDIQFTVNSVWSDCAGVTGLD
jgi:hypothetical protein